MKSLRCPFCGLCVSDDADGVRVHPEVANVVGAWVCDACKEERGKATKLAMDSARQRFQIEDAKEGIRWPEKEPTK